LIVALFFCLIDLPAAQTTVQRADWRANVELAEAVDLNADPRIVEINLDARLANVDVAGRTVRAWTYNGGVPGPLIRVRVGDRLIVHFTNNLPQNTTVHWHGVRVPVQMDGVPGSSQPDVWPGRSFTYDFVVPDAGLYWYHPHIMSAAQVGFGLYGALLVEDPTENVGVTDEVVLVLSDMAVTDEGTMESPDSGGSLAMAFGREGNRVLVNGRTKPTLHARSGAPQRWRIVNAAKSRYFTLDLEGVPFTVIGRDGGLQEFAVETNPLLLTPGERADVIVTPRVAPGTQLTLRSLLHYRGFGSVEFRPVEQLLTLAVDARPRVTAPQLAKIQRAIEPLDLAGATAVDIDLTIKQDEKGDFEYGINGVPFSKAHAIVARPGETQIWTVKNSTKWSHPFHLHGFFFQVLDANNVPVRPLAWRDTVDVPLEETVRLAVRFDDRPGTWMYHCHILDHADGGLMGTVQVGEPGEPHVHP
jgi:FtsP/CotA-like multicopper oxidase with cupredoxin domain